MADQKIKIIPKDERYKINDVIVDGFSIGPVEEYTFKNIKKSHTLHAEFGLKTFTLSPIGGPNGDISPDSDIVVLWNENYTFNFTPNQYFRINDVIIDGVSQGPIESYIFENIQEDHVISVSFYQYWLPGYDYRYSLLINNEQIPEDDSTITNFPVYINLNGMGLNESSRTIKENILDFGTGELTYVRNKNTGLTLVDFEEIIETLKYSNRGFESVDFNVRLLSMEGNSEIWYYFEWYDQTIPETTYFTPSISVTDLGDDGLFSYEITELYQVKKYSYRAIATNGIETWYGDWSSIDMFVGELFQNKSVEIISGSKRELVITIDYLESDYIQNNLSLTEVLSGSKRTAILIEDSFEIENFQNKSVEIISGTKT